MSFSLMMALLNEHKQRTGHDCTAHNHPRIRTVECDVCLFLSNEVDAQNKAEREYYEEGRQDLQLMSSVTLDK